MIEVELKIPIKDLKKYEKRLLELNADFLGEEEQTDLYFQHPCKNFVETDEALRIRLVNGRAYLTYKGPRLSSEMKVRNEVEVEVLNAEKMQDILNYLDFKMIAVIKKVRRIYKVGNFKVSLDRVTKLGSFIEVEVITSGDDNDVINKIKKFASILDLPLDKGTVESYLEMYLKKYRQKL